MSIGIIGSGAFGTALAISLSHNGPVDLWARSDAQAQAMQADRENKARLPGVTLPDTLTATSDFDRVASNDILLLAIPMQQIRSVLVAHPAALSERTLVACCKGIE